LQKYKLLLIHPFNRDLLKVESNSLKRGLSNYALFEPLCLGILAALTNEKWNVKILDECIEELTETSTCEFYDLVAITSDTCTIPRAIEISKMFREKNIKTIIGGIHASVNIEESKKFFNIVVIGEAEMVWRELIHDYETNCLKELYKTDTFFDLNNAVLPRRDLFSDKYVFSVVYTSRGCPSNCTFCAVTKFFGRKQRHRPIESVICELKEIKQGKMVFFSDDDIIGNSKSGWERARMLFKQIIENDIKINWHAFASIEIAYHDDILESAAKSGCRWLYIGIESINKLVLKEMNKSKNIVSKTASVNKLIKKINSYGIMVYGGFIIGNDNDDKKNIRKLIRFIKYSFVNGFALFVLTPLPGTDLFQKMLFENRLFYNNYPKDWTRYNLSELSFTPKQIMADDFNQEYKRGQLLLNSRSIKYIKFILTLYTTRSLDLAKEIYNFYKYSVNV